MRRRPISLLDAPSNLGLRPPAPGCAPGCYKQPWALRDRGLLARLGARDAGVVVPARYVPDWAAGDGVRNAAAIADFSNALAKRVGGLLDKGRWPLVLGGDCSILLGNLLALKRRGRYGLAFLDAHADFRHSGNAPAIGAAAGEDLALVTGRGDPRLIDLDGNGPLMRETDVVLIGVHAEDDDLAEVTGLGLRVFTTAQVRHLGGAVTARRALRHLLDAPAGFWIHLDWDVVDARQMPAVDSPEPDGLTFKQVSAILRGLLKSPHCVGLELTIYDPDLDPTGEVADGIVTCLETAFAADRTRG